MDRFTHIVLALWAIWVCANFLLFLLGAALVRPKNTAHFNGFRVIIPPAVREILTPSELSAVIEHEEGHRHHHHVWHNLFRLLVFHPVSERERQDQELEADDCVSNQTALASALRKMGAAGFDLSRVERLDRRWALQGSRDAGTSRPGGGTHFAKEGQQ